MNDQQITPPIYRTWVGRSGERRDYITNLSAVVGRPQDAPDDRHRSVYVSDTGAIHMGPINNGEWYQAVRAAVDAHPPGTAHHRPTPNPPRTPREKYEAGLIDGIAYTEYLMESGELY